MINREVTEGMNSYARISLVMIIFLLLWLES